MILPIPSFPNSFVTMSKDKKGEEGRVGGEEEQEERSEEQLGAVGGVRDSEASSEDYQCLTDVDRKDVMVVDALTLRRMLPKGESFGSSRWILGTGGLANDPDDQTYYLINSDLQYVRPISEFDQAVLAEDHQRSLRKRFLRSGSLVFSESATSSRSVSLIGLDNMVSAEESARQVEELQEIWNDVMGVGPLPEEIITEYREARREAEEREVEGAVGGAAEGAIGGEVEGAAAEASGEKVASETQCEHGENLDECPICLQNFGGNFAILKCQHRFCQDCVDRQLVVKRTRFRRRQLNRVGEYAVPIKCAMCRALCTTDEIEYVVNYEELTGQDRDDFEAERRSRQERLEASDPQPRRLIITNHSDLQGYYDEAFEANDQAILDVLDNGTVVSVNDTEVIFYASTGEVVVPTAREAAREAEVAAMNIPAVPLPNVLTIPRTRLARGNLAPGAAASSDTAGSQSVRGSRSASNGRRGRSARQAGRPCRAATCSGASNTARRAVTGANQQRRAVTGANQQRRNQSASRRRGASNQQQRQAASSRGRNQQGRSATRSQSRGQARGRVTFGGAGRQPSSGRNEPNESQTRADEREEERLSETCYRLNHE